MPVHNKEGWLMATVIDPIPGVTDDPVLQLILAGRAANLDEAEELFLDESLPIIIELIGSPICNEELETHPLLTLLRSRDARPGGFHPVNSDERLAQIVAALESVGLPPLVMGGHAVRFYGLQRNTIDFDLHLAPDRWDDLPQVLSRTPLFSGGSVVEGNSWRPHAFRRFQIGRLPDGREEWLEFWRENHLLPPFAELHARRETGRYGGRSLDFLSLPDLIRSKETERTSDWQDVDVLEEFLDARRLARVKDGLMVVPEALASLRSRVGLECFLQAGHLSDPKIVSLALRRAVRSVTQALLLPFSPASAASDTVPAIEPVVVKRLRTVAPASPLHLALVEAVRRQYRVIRQAADRQDKEALRLGRRPPQS